MGINQFLFSQKDYPNCTNPKKIQLPLSIGGEEGNVEEIYYQSVDDYTYWYQITGTSNCSLNYRMDLISEDDDYELLLYKNEGNNFCNDIINKQVKPISFKKEGALSVKKGEVYFFNVVYLNGNGCGHNLALTTGENKLNIKAIQNECVEDVMEEILIAEKEILKPLVDFPIDTVAIVPKVNFSEVQKDTVDTNKVEHKIEIAEALEVAVKTSNHNISCRVVNKKTKKNIEAFVTVSGINTDYKNSFLVRSKDGYKIDNYKDTLIFISVKKLGYVPFLDTIAVKSESFTIELSPIAVGEKLTMKRVYFHPNTYVLKEESEKELNSLLEFMLENKSYSFEIQGHTNGNRAVKKSKKYAHLGEDWNFKGTSKKLSKLRAEKIKTYLIKNGVVENQLITAGYGGDRMIIRKPKNMKQAMKNIRVEVIVIE